MGRGRTVGCGRVFLGLKRGLRGGAGGGWKRGVRGMMGGACWVGGRWRWKMQ